jgi:hypothetical protein
MRFIWWAPRYLTLIYKNSLANGIAAKSVGLSTYAVIRVYTDFRIFHHYVCTRSTHENGKICLEDHEMQRLIRMYIDFPVLWSKDHAGYMGERTTRESSQLQAHKRVACSCCRCILRRIIITCMHVSAKQCCI